MPLDAVCLKAVAEELNISLTGGKVDRVCQPDRDEIVLFIRGAAGGNNRLLISATASAPRMHLIEDSIENPATPPMFCMLLRKHLQGARIVSITQPELERLVTITFDTVDEMGVRCQKHLICEIMGKYSNIILKGADERIIDAVHRVDGDISGKRQILPGMFYRMPPAQENKISPLSISDMGFLAALRNADSEMRLDKWLLEHFIGISPLLCRELSFRATGETGKIIGKMTDAEYSAIHEVFMDFCVFVRSGKATPILLTRRDQPDVFDFYCLPITQYENSMEVTTASGFSVLLSTFFEKKSIAERMHRKSGDLFRTVTTARDRMKRKLLVQQQELEQTKERDSFRHLGDLITANLYQLEKGMSSANVVNYFNPDCAEVNIKLDMRLTPQQNAQVYYKQYNKAKTAEEMLTVQVKHGQMELDYLESVLGLIDEAECEQDIAQLREELQSTGVLTAKKLQKGKREKPAKAMPFAYQVADGFTVFAGKNNLQNDLLTLKTACKSDIWLHTQKIHGSHVILFTEGREPTDAALTQAAMIAALHSKAKNSSLVPVDYTPVKFVKKPAGAKPGLVIYTVYKTAFVTPDRELIEKFRTK